MLGSHTIKHWSKTQSGVALSSGEAELYALVKASTETLGILGMIQEMGYTFEGVVATDSSAAKGAVARIGCGRLKHVQLNTFWIQEQAAQRRLRFVKLPRELNVADLLTHHWNAAEGERHLRRMGLYSH